MSLFLAAAHEVGALCSQAQFHSTGRHGRLGWHLPLFVAVGRDASRPVAVAQAQDGIGTCWAPQQKPPQVFFYVHFGCALVR